MLIYKRYPFACLFAILCILHIFAIFVATFSEDRFNDVIYPSGIGWRSLYEMMIGLSAYLIFAKRYKIVVLPFAYAAAAFAGFFMIVDEIYFLVVSAAIAFFGLEFAPKPQEGVMAIAVIVLVALGIKTVIKPTFYRIVHCAFLVIATLFLLFTHVLAIALVGEKVERLNLKSLSHLITSEYLEDYCQLEGYGCYIGPYREDGDYKIILKSDLSPFAYSQFISQAHVKVGVQTPDNTLRIGGVIDINKHAKTTPFLIHQWNTGWTDVSNIDQPEKYIAYFKRGDEVRVVMDYYSAIEARSFIVQMLRYILLLFSFVWLLCGLLIALKHGELPRFRDK